MDLNEAGLYKELGVLTKDKSKWEENNPFLFYRAGVQSVQSFGGL